MSLIDLSNEVAERIRDTKTDTINHIKVFVNDTYHDIWGRANWRFALISGHTFNTESSRAEYALPSEVDHVLIMRIDSCSQILTPMDWIELRECELTGTTGIPESYALGGLAGVEKQPVSPGTVSIVSSNDSDTSITVTIHGMVSGTIQFETITLNGTTPVSTSTSFSHIRRVVKSETTKGIITVNCGSDSLLVLAPGALTADFRLVRLFPSPGDTLTITYDYKKRPGRLQGDYDVPHLPLHTWNILKDGATMRALMWQKPENSREINHFRTLYEEGIRIMMLQEGCHSGIQQTSNSTYFNSSGDDSHDRPMTRITSP